MLTFLKNLLQLTLSPSKGWEDVSASLDNPQDLLNRAFLPLLGVASLSEFVRLFYPFNSGVLIAFELAIASFASFCVSFFIVGALLPHYMEPLVDGELNKVKLEVFSIYSLSLLVVIQLVENILPTDLTLVRFLPLFVALIIYRATGYLSVRRDCELRFLLVAAMALIVMPLSIFFLLSLIIG